MSIIPIDTNFHGVQKRFVPKCAIVDIYDLECIYFVDLPPNTAFLQKLQTLIVLSGGSIVTNVSITSITYPKITDDNLQNAIIFIATSSKPLTDAFDPTSYTDGRNLILFHVNNTAKYSAFPALGSPVRGNVQLMVEYIHIGGQDNNALTIPHVQFVIEYIAEEQ